MSNRRRRHGPKVRPTGKLHLLAAGVATVTVALFFSLRSLKSEDKRAAEPSLAQPVQNTEVQAISDEKLQYAADQLLTLVDPERLENDYFPNFARERLRWMVQEHAAGRLDVAFLTDTSSASLPADVLMAASWPAGRPTLIIAKPRFMKFLIETGATQPPFTTQQKNDFALALVHEIIHLQNSGAEPLDRAVRSAEEARVWREVSLQVVRPLRERNQPVHRRFLDVDDALRLCRDELPCPSLARLVTDSR